MHQNRASVYILFCPQCALKGISEKITFLVQQRRGLSVALSLLDIRCFGKFPLLAQGLHQMVQNLS